MADTARCSPLHNGGIEILQTETQTFVRVVLVVNVIAVLAMPPALVFLFMLVNDRELMNGVVSPRWANALATAVVLFLTGAGVFFGIGVIAPNLFAALGGK